jgi:hypothetical protein
MFEQADKKNGDKVKVKFNKSMANPVYKEFFNTIVPARGSPGTPADKFMEATSKFIEMEGRQSELFFLEGNTYELSKAQLKDLPNPSLACYNGGFRGKLSPLNQEAYEMYANPKKVSYWELVNA